MTANYVLLQETTLSTAASSVTFSGLPSSGYTDLKLVCSTRSTYANTYDAMSVAFNGSSSSFSMLLLQGSGSGTYSGTGTTYLGDWNGGTSTANTYTNAEVYIPNYLSSNYKSVSIDSTMENNATTAYAEMTAMLWSNTAAITSITLTQGSGGDIAAGSSFSIYGIAALGTTPAPTSAAYASGGDIIQTDGTYWYHAFLSSGTFTPAKTLSCDVLVVAGGGGGGYWNGGGGGAGGLLGFTAQSVNATSQTIVVGAGGVGSNTDSVKAVSGNNSQFSLLTAAVGGGGAASNGDTTGSNGGSGGGGAPLSGPGGSGTPGQGNDGGVALGGSPYIGGGGGGAAQAGNNAGQGYGGNGVSTYSSWGLATFTGQNVDGTVYYAGGGSGAGNGGAGLSIPGGSGGGGQGATSTGGSGSAGTLNTGGGGGASSNPGGTGGAGGSGIVIVRYAV